MASTGGLASSLWVYGMLLCGQQPCTNLARGTCRGAWGSHLVPDMAGREGDMLFNTGSTSTSTSTTGAAEPRPGVHTLNHKLPGPKF